MSGKLTQANTLNLSTAQASAIGTVYLVGEVVGALVFGRLSDKLGRRRLFMWTLAIYLVGTGFSALAFKGGGGLVYFYATRFIAGTGIGGEYSAVNSAIDEMMPARCRGRTVSGPDRPRARHGFQRAGNGIAALRLSPAPDAVRNREKTLSADPETPRSRR